jgi:serine/threonine-protein kinase
LGLEQIILKATGKRAEERYQKAEDMLTDMKRLLADPTYTINLENEEVLDQTILLSQKDTQLLRDMPIAPQVSSESQSAPIPPQKDTDEEEISTSYKILMMAGGALATLVIMGIALVSIFFFLPSFGKTKYISVPSVIERTQEEAREILENANLKMQVTGFEASTIYEEGRILRQTPNAAETIKPGSTIEVIVATAGEVQEVVQEKVPDVTGLNASEAQRQLEIRGFLSEIIEMVYDEEVPQGKVISQEPLGNTLLNVGETVGIVVSNGSKTTMTIVPNLYNLTEAEARESLRNNMLDLGTVTEVANENIAIGHVVYQDVRANSQVEQGTLINIEISKGPQTVEEILPPEPSLPEEEPPVENVTPEEPEVAVIRQKTYVLKLPQGVEEKDDYQVLVTFETSEGILTLYESTVFKEQFPLPITISGKGSGRLITYFDGKPEYDDRIDFNEEN